jgi:hypothetical protein
VKILVDVFCGALGESLELSLGFGLIVKHKSKTSFGLSPKTKQIAKGPEFG